MKPGNTLKAALILGVLLVIFFDVTLVLDFGGVQTSTRADPRVEAQFKRCYQDKDDAMHDVAFGTIDNPDVQREFISANRARIERECRALHPQQRVTVEETSGFNLIDLRPRFW